MALCFPLQPRHPRVSVIVVIVVTVFELLYRRNPIAAAPYLWFD